MKQYLLSLILVFAVCLPSCGGTPVSANVSAITTFGLPVLEITTVDGEEPTYEHADAPEGCLGGSIRNATKVPGRVRLCDSTGVFFDSGPYEKSVSGMTVKVRGNWSARRPQKPYKIKLQRPANMLIPAAGVRADRNWVLIPFFQLNYMIGLKVGELMGMPWTPRFRFVNLVFNDHYRGLYLLMESVERNPTRLDVAESGFIAELDAYWWNEDVYAVAGFEEPLNYTFKYPDGDDLTPSRLDSIQQVLTAAEASLADSTCRQHVDVESFARWMLTHDILGNRDGAGSNMYISKYDDSDTTLLRMDCLWDLDVIMESEGWDELHSRYYFGALFRSADRTFAERYAALWEESRDRVIDGILDFLDHYMASELRQAVDASIRLNNSRWALEQYAIPLSDEHVAEARRWFLDRRVWLDEAVTIVTGIRAPRNQGNQGDRSFDFPSCTNGNQGPVPLIHDLLGRRIGRGTSVPGTSIYIQNGRKMIKK